MAPSSELTPKPCHNVGVRGARGRSHTYACVSRIQSDIIYTQRNKTRTHTAGHTQKYVHTCKYTHKPASHAGRGGQPPQPHTGWKAHNMTKVTPPQPPTPPHHETTTKVRGKGGDQ